LGFLVMSYSWFKVHHDILIDTRMRKFTAGEKWAWIVLLALASLNQEGRGSVQADDEDLADQCEFGSVKDWQYFKDKLKAKGMIDITPSGLSIVGWDRIQGRKPSQEPEATRERKQKERERKSGSQSAPEQRDLVDVTRMSHPVTRCHADVTPCHATDKTRSEEIRSEETRQDTQDPDRADVREISKTSEPEAGQAEKTPFNLDPFGGTKAVLNHYRLGHLVADGRREGSRSQSHLPNWNQQIRAGVTALSASGSLGSTYKESPLKEDHRICAYLDGLFFGLKKKDDIEQPTEYLRSISKLEAACKAGEIALEAVRAIKARQSAPQAFRVVTTGEKLASDLKAANSRRKGFIAGSQSVPGWLNRRISDLEKSIAAESAKSRSIAA
jgi:hypothetical protein